MSSDFLNKKILEVFNRFERLENQLTSLEHVMSAASDGPLTGITPDAARPSFEEIKNLIREEITKQTADLTTRRAEQPAKDHYDMEILGIRIKFDNALAEIKKNMTEFEGRMAFIERRVSEFQLKVSSQSSLGKETFSEPGVSPHAEEVLEIKLQELTAKTGKSVLLMNAKMEHEFDELRRRVEKIEKDLPL